MKPIGNVLNKHVKVSYDVGGYNVMTLKRVLNKYKSMPMPFLAHAKAKILTDGWRFDSAFYSLTEEQITVI